MARKKRSLDDTFYKIEEILKEYKYYKAYIKILELNKKLYADDTLKQNSINKKIEYYKKMDLNITKCLDILNADELKFIEEKYFNNKTNRELLPSTKKIMYGDENIDKKIIIAFSTLIKKVSIVRNIILAKLLNENILGVIEHDNRATKSND